MVDFARMPLRRSADIKVVELEGETLIYDLSSHKSHCLNGTASLVWRYCDGTSQMEDVAALLGDDLAGNLGEEVLRLALRQLAEAGLLTEQTTVPADDQTLSRRALLKRMAGVGVAAAALPVVASLVAPGAAEAASPTPVPTETPVTAPTDTPVTTSTPTVTSTPTTTSTPTVTSTPTTTSTPTVTSTPTSTSTPTVTSSPTSTSTPTVPPQF